MRGECEESIETQPRADVTRSPKQGVPVTPQKGLMFYEISLPLYKILIKNF